MGHFWPENGRGHHTGDGPNGSETSKTNENVGPPGGHLGQHVFRPEHPPIFPKMNLKIEFYDMFKLSREYLSEGGIVITSEAYIKIGTQKVMF